MSFMIDDGQLDGLSQQECFALGYELAKVTVMAMCGQGFDCLVRSENRDRMQAMLQSIGRAHRFEWCKNDKSEFWLNLYVDGGEPYKMAAECE